MTFPLRQNDIGARPALGEALLADPPGPATAVELMTFGRFVGSWDLARTWYHDDGSRSATSGQVHFGWVLAGTAVQDVWISPRPGDRLPEGVAGFHGTTIRFRDRGGDGWRSTWVDPQNGRVRRFIGRPDGQDITLWSIDDDPWLRWSFTDIEPDRFRWTGERSTDHGVSWQLEEEMLATRSPSGARPR